ncbi:MAG: S41 family peptidase, partial [Bacteroidia bacterium]|nr:S41 family peptidase [Bacteroidia bacterium]
IKRGMLFDRVNGTVMNATNYRSLTTITTADVTLGFVEPIYDTEGVVTGYTNLTQKTLQTVTDYSENPVYLDSILQIDGHKIGYFVYHFFAPDNGSENYAYDLEMNSVFGTFKSEGITDLILDLRYNSGGRTTSAQLLASELVPDVLDTKLFAYYRYNLDLNASYIKQYGADKLKTYFTTKVMGKTAQIGTVNNIGNQIGGKIYILTGQYTASASEQIINGLKPYMDVVLIGDTTYGKNEASSTFYDKDHTDKNKWGMQPINAKYFNSLGKSDFTAGFAPDFVVRDGGLNMKEFGDRNEPLLNKALNDILGTQALPLVQMRAQTLKTDRLLSIPGKRIRGLQLDNLPLNP